MPAMFTLVPVMVTALDPCTAVIHNSELTENSTYIGR